MDIEYNNTAQRYKELGNREYKGGDYNKAINYYNKAIEIDQADPSYFSNRAICYYNLNRFEDCIMDCDHALRINSNLAKVYKKKAQACSSLLRFDEAVEAAKANASIEKTSAANN
jgi:tetratricopeptide (TPR) repeat protein